MLGFAACDLHVFMKTFFMNSTFIIKLLCPKITIWFSYYSLVVRRETKVK